MKGLTAGLLVFTALAAATPACAQFASGGGPIDIAADELELIDAQHLAIWRGAVDALQSGNRVRANQISIYFSGKPTARGSDSSGPAPGKNWGRVERVEAEGDVFFISPSQTARGDHGLYQAGSDTITITGDVVVAQGPSVVHGDKLIIDLKTNQARMVSSDQTRVRGVFYPNGTGAPAPRP
jgi:lipopolysaccharide export system protein LptA